VQKGIEGKEKNASKLMEKGGAFKKGIQGIQIQSSDQTKTIKIIVGRR